MTEFIYNTENLVSTQKEQSFLSYELVDPKDPILTTKTQDFDFNSEIDITELASRLVETANTFNTFGLSANQCGLPHRVCVVGHGDEYVAFFNPEIIEYSDEEILLPESDVSNFGLVLKIKRPKNVVVKYKTYEGNELQVRLEGITSRVIQHHIDRLNGIDFKSKVSELILNRSKKALDKKVKRYVRNIMTYTK